MSAVHGRVMLGRLANGAQADHGRQAHAVAGELAGKQSALCGAKPGRRSVGWCEERHAITCPRCLKLLESKAALPDLCRAAELRDAIAWARHWLAKPVTPGRLTRADLQVRHDKAIAEQAEIRRRRRS